jgi:hypothetical protein
MWEDLFMAGNSAHLSDAELVIMLIIWSAERGEVLIAEYSGFKIPHLKMIEG